MTEVSQSDYNKATLRFANILRSLPEELSKAYISPNGWKPFLPVVSWEQFTGRTAIVSDEVARRIEMLLGPNAETLVHMWVIQNVPHEASF